MSTIQRLSTLDEFEPQSSAVDYESTFRKIGLGHVVKGAVISISPKEVVVDIGFKSEGVIPAYEFDQLASLKIGDEVEVLLEETENEKGQVVLSKKKAEKSQGWDRVIAEVKEGDSIEGRVTRKVKGGLMMDVGVEAFLPASLAFLKGFGSLNALLGQTIQVKIVKINPSRKNIIVSRKDVLEKEKQESKAKTLEELEVGSVRKGTVKNITDFGAFINLGGVDGLLHITDMSWGRVGHPSEVVSVGQKLDVMILGFDRETMKISLGLKQLTPNPWEKVESNYQVGSRVKGKVVSVMPYGAFVELQKGVEGLVHISEFSWTKRPSHPNEVVKVGDEVECVVLSIDRDNQKIALGFKQAEQNPWEGFLKDHPVGTRLTGRVQHMTEYGAFVELADGIEGLLHVQDISWTRRYNHPFECLKKGQELEVMITSAEPENRKVSLSLKALQPDPWPSIAERYPSGTLVEGKVTKIAPFGVFIEIEKDLDGLAHLSELPVRLPQHLKRASTGPRKPAGKADKGAAPVAAAAAEGEAQPEAVIAFLESQYKVGDTLQARVLRVDEEQRRIALSLKRV